MTQVRRLSDGKIFSSPRGVAMAAGKPIAKAVHYCCQGYIFEVEREKYEWVYGEDDRGKVDTSKSYWNRRGKWTTKHSSWNAQNTIRNIIFQRSIVFKNWINKVGTEEAAQWRTPKILSYNLEKVYEETKDQYQFPWIFTAQILSRHLRAYDLLYRKMFGMYEHYLSSPVYKGHLFKFVIEDADSEFNILINEVITTLERGNTKPVIRLNDNMWFESMNAAERVTGVPYYRIFHCCEGDIPHYEVPLTGEKMEFRYATEVQRK